MNPTLRQLAAAPWAITEEMAPAIADILEFRLSGVALSADEVAARLGSGRSADVGATAGAVAVIPITGVITPDADEWFDGTAPAAIGKALEAAVANSAVSAIVLAIDSPGGSVYGVPELAEQIAAAAKQKRVVAVATGMMASAAYWLGVAAGEVVVTPSGQVGSIGVYTMHVDVSRALENFGVKVTLVKAGKYKAEGAPFAPLSDEARAALQASVDDYYEQFVGAVAKHRGVTMAAVKSGFGEGRVENARPALAKGMVDRIDTLAGVLAELTGAKRSGGRTLGYAAEAQPSFAAELNATLPPAPPLAPGLAYAPTTTTAGPPATTQITLVPAAASTGGRAVSAPDPAASAAEPAAATGAGASPAAGLSTTPATSARSATVPENTSAATNGAAAGDNDIARAREAKLRKLAKTHQKDVAWLDAAIESGKSIEAIQDDLLGERVANSAAHAVPAAGGSNVHLGADRAAEKPFANFGEQLLAIRAAAVPGATVDPRLLHVQRTFAGASGGNTSVGSEGGFLVHPTFATEIFKRAYENNALLSRCNVQGISGGSDRLTIPYIDETSRASGSRLGGVQVYRRAEADTVTAKKPKLGELTLKLEDLMGIAYLTGRAEEDAANLGTVYEQAFGEEFAFVIQSEIVRGNGAGQMQGIVAAPCTVSVSKESGQLAATINAKNIMKMWARMWGRSRANAVWLINQDCEPQLHEMQIGTGASGQLVYLPPGGLSSSPYGTIYGRPVIPIEQCSTVGTVGDIVLADLSQYLVVTKGGLRTEQSMHVRFLYDENTYRFMYRINGAPIWQSALTPAQGTNTLSPFVTLATRA